MNTNLELNTVAFLKKTLADMRGDVDYSYPGSHKYFESGRAHTSLQMVASKIETLQNFLAALEPKQDL